MRCATATSGLAFRLPTPPEIMAVPSPAMRKLVASAKSWLRFSYNLFNLCALACILLLLTAGTRISGSGHPGTLDLNYYDLSLVSFDGPVWYSYPNGGSELESRSHWFLTSFGWSMQYAEESNSAGFIYRRPGQELRFPQIIDALNSSLFPVNLYDDVIECGTDCPLSIPVALRDAFARRPFAMQTAPAYVFYVIALALVPAMIIFEWAIVKDKRKKTQWRLSMAAIAVVSHLIAAGIITGESGRLIAYLHNFDGMDMGVGDVYMSPERGRHTLLVTWLGFLATVLAGLSILGRTCLGWRVERWRSTDQEMALASELRTHRVSESASEALPEYSPRDPMPREEGKGASRTMTAAPPFRD